MIEYSGEYVLVNQNLNAYDAEDYCMHQYGTHLATIQNTTDNEIAVTLKTKQKTKDNV